jgi:hypothetical protein
MIMKKFKLLLSVVSVVLFALMFYSCATDEDEEDLSSSERIDRFISDINSNRANAYRNLYDSAGSKYNQVKGKTDYWDGVFGGSPKNIAIGSSSSLSTSITGGTLGNGRTINFTMEQVGNNFLISAITISGGSPSIGSVYP